MIFEEPVSLARSENLVGGVTREFDVEGLFAKILESLRDCSLLILLELFKEFTFLWPEI